jgi:hypothetical protein
MDEHKAAAVLGTAIAVFVAGSEPASASADWCVGRSEMACAIEPDKPADQRDRAHPRPVAQRPEAAQFPPPVMPPGRGMTDLTQYPDPYWGHHAAILSSTPFRNHVLLDSV